MNSAARDQRITDRIHLVRPIAARIRNKLSPRPQLAELCSIGKLALVEACDESTPAGHPETSEPSSQDQPTYDRKISWSIRSAILDSVRYSISRKENLYGLVQREYSKVYSESNAASLDLARALAKLPVRERLVIELRYAEGFSQAEVGRELGVSQTRARAIEARAIQALRERLCPRVVRKAA